MLIEKLQNARKRMRYIRMYVGSEKGEPGLSIYEVDKRGTVHRFAQISQSGARFIPEDILMLRGVNAEYMVNCHPFCDELAPDAFETMWSDIEQVRNFRKRIPDAERAWHGILDFDRRYSIRWHPDAVAKSGWRLIPGFRRLFIRGNIRDSWRVQRGIFLEAPIDWKPI